MKIRLWKLGSLEHGVIPTKQAITKLRLAVEKLTKEEKDVLNFVWGPDITVQEFEFEDKKED